MTHCYWAEFVESGKDVFRYDTRIYICPIDRIEEDDYCIGAVIGKNPGSAKSVAIDKGMQAINLDGDKLLPTVRNIVKESYEKAGIKLPKRGYIQVLNLLYLCNPNLKQAISDMEKYQNGSDCNSENQSFPWVWYVWGDAPKKLRTHKNRLSKIESKNHFYYDKKGSTVKAERPSESAFAKHTQGLKHEEIVCHLAGIITSSDATMAKNAE